MRTAEGGESSAANQSEVDQVVSYFKLCIGEGGEVEGRGRLLNPNRGHPV